MLTKYPRESVLRSKTIAIRAALFLGLSGHVGCSGTGTPVVQGKLPPTSGCLAAHQACSSDLGCAGTLECVGGKPVCQAPLRNNCGICGAADEADVGKVCQAPGDRTGVQVCAASGGTTCASTVVSFTVDDTFGDAELAAQAFEAHGLRVTFFVNSPRFGGPGYLSFDQVVALQQKGHEIGGHTLDHPPLPYFNSDLQRRNICHDRAELLAAGLDVKNFAYPYGAYIRDGGMDDVRPVVAGCGYNSARAIGGVLDHTADETTDGGEVQSERFSPRDRWALRTPSSITADQTLDILKGYIVAAEKTGGWVILNMHHICDLCPPGQPPCELCRAQFDPTGVSPQPNYVNLSDLKALLDWLVPRQAGGTVVQNLRQMLWGPTQPSVDSEVTPPPPGTNLLQDPSLETDFNVNHVPDCWELKWQGNNDSPDGGLIVPTPHSGAEAARVLVSSYTTGRRGLMTQRKLQICTPTLKAGSSYRLSAWYIAPSSTPLFQADFLADGLWSTWLTSPIFPATSTYRQAVWTTPPVPAGQEVVSVGLMLDSAGSITVDDLDLEELP
jgi:peptidoglycan/xylan/chitin deacetylase (PgdA/CDA1 family)